MLYGIREVFVDACYVYVRKCTSPDQSGNDHGGSDTKTQSSQNEMEIVTISLKRPQKIWLRAPSTEPIGGCFDEIEMGAPTVVFDATQNKTIVRVGFKRVRFGCTLPQCITVPMPDPPVPLETSGKKKTRKKVAISTPLSIAERVKRIDELIKKNPQLARLRGSRVRKLKHQVLRKQREANREIRDSGHDHKEILYVLTHSLVLLLSKTYTCRLTLSLVVSMSPFAWTLYLPYEHTQSPDKTRSRWRSFKNCVFRSF